VQSLNENLQSVGESPVRLKKIGETNYTTKVAKTESAIRKKSFRISSDDGTSALPTGSDSIVLQQLKEKFLETTNRSVILILTLLPKDWSIRKTEEFPGASNYMKRSPKQLVKEYGILASPNPKPGRSLHSEVAYIVEKITGSVELCQEKGTMWQLKLGVQKNTNKRD
jgi:hypothetical protein